MIYPNLIEMIKYHPYHISTLADHAGVTTELMQEAAKGRMVLPPEERQRIARLYRIPSGLLFLPKLVRMNKGNRKHQKMVEELMAQLSAIHDHHRQGSREADTFMIYGRAYLVNLELAFLDDRATYCQYLGVNERVNQVLQFIDSEQRKPRGLERSVNNDS